MIPARLGSKRVKMKNLRYLGDKPLVAHVIDACKASGVFDAIYLNSDDEIFAQVAKDNGISFYRRDPKFAAPDVTNDLFMEDFLKNTDCDYAIQVNPTSPFITSDDIRSVKDLLIEKGHHTVQSVKYEKIEGIFNGKPLNYDPTRIMPESQKLEPVILYSSGVMGFKKDVYFDNMKKYGAATYGGTMDIGYHEIKGFATIDIDWEEDFQLAEVVWEFLHKHKAREAKFYQTEKEIADADRERILIMDGVGRNILHDFNKEVASVPQLLEKYGHDKSWSHTLVNSKSNCATLIAQMPGEGNRMHYHPDWDEFWYIVDGEWEWMVDGQPKCVQKGDVVFIERNRRHKITAKGSKMAIRLAVSREDVDHVYTQDEYNNQI